MIERGDGAVLFGLPVSAGIPVPQLGNVGTAAAASTSSATDSMRSSAWQAHNPENTLSS
jgi:hypothetical protein